MNIRNYESRQTHQAWGTGSGSPALMVLTCLVVNFITLIVTIVINLTVINDGSNDYSEGSVAPWNLKSLLIILTSQYWLGTFGSRTCTGPAMDTR